MTSARTQLVTALTAALPPTYRVVGTPDVPDTIDPGTFAVRAWAAKLAPATTTDAVLVDLVVWVLSPRQTPGAADDDLDTACDEVMAALHAMTWTTPATAERAVMEDADGGRWQGWRFTSQAAAQMTVT
jgi:hypothetical protein